MKIDIEKAEKQFIEHTNKYDLKNEEIKRKIGHSIRVMEISKQIATKLGVSTQEIELSELIGLLHDIGRFKEYTEFETFEDMQSFDHGDYGVEVLNKDIRKYIEEEQYDEIIKKAVKNHNKLKIEKGLTQEQLLFSKIIRDADKLDIMYESVELFYKGNEEEVNKSILTHKIYEDFKENKIIKREKNTSYDKVNDIASVIAFIYDINFKQTYEIIKEQDYINKILDRYDFEDKETKEKIEEMRVIANEYINKKLKN